MDDAPPHETTTANRHGGTLHGSSNATGVSEWDPLATCRRQRLCGWKDVIRATLADWQTDGGSRLGAALAYYAIFSLAPLLLIATAVAGLVFGPQAASGQLQHELETYLGNEAAIVVANLVARARQPQAGLLASAIGIGALLVGATGLFSQLKEALNIIWNVPAGREKWWKTITDRLLSFLMVLAIGVLLVVSFVVSTTLSAIQTWMNEIVPGPPLVWQLANAAGSWAVATALFALIFKYLPDVTVAWKDVWLGSAVTAILFTIGKGLFGLYLAHGTINSTYGAAGSVIVVLLWAYYSSQLLLLGAEFTQAYSRAFGSRHEPSRP